MIRLGSLAFFFCLVFKGEGQLLSSDSWQSAAQKKTGEITVLHLELHRYAFTDKKSGNLDGICVEIFKDFLEYVKIQKGVTLIPKFVGDGKDFKKMYQAVRDGQGGVFGIGNISISEMRKKEVSFTTPYLQSRALLITSANVPTLSSLKDIPKVFSGFKAYSIEKTRVEDDIEQIKNEYLPDLVVNKVENYASLASSVAADPESFSFVGINHLFEYRDLSIKYHPAGSSDPIGLGFILPRHSDWIQIFDQFMAFNGGYTKSDRYEEILLKHLGASGYRLMMSIQD